MEIIMSKINKNCINTWSRLKAFCLSIDEVLYFHCWRKADLISVWKKVHAIMFIFCTSSLVLNIIFTLTLKE